MEITKKDFEIFLSKIDKLTEAINESNKIKLKSLQLEKKTYNANLTILNERKQNLTS